ncbi:MAG: ferrous iron transport protein B [Oscillospiraceae bacterium]|nr:ferrous iron transport protein B [Oscillospiraceae bacterium]
MTLRQLEPGKTAVILSVGGTGALRRHLLDMGLIKGTEVSVVKYAPMGDPVEIRIHGYELTLRLADAEQIEIGASYDAIPHKNTQTQKSDISHPGYGEGGKFHNKKEENNPVPDGEKLTFALVGNQNCGKTTLFNALTGSNQHVGNFPGVTVDRKDGEIKGYPNTVITDLPGIYSLSPFSSEEIVTRQFILTEKPHAIINILDATNIERNLYLTMQLLELGFPMVIALNMMDELTANGGSVKINEMEALLGVPVIPISAAKNEGIGELTDHLIHVAKYREGPEREDYCAPDGKDYPIHRSLHAIMHLIEDHASAENTPVRFAASKLIEGDEPLMESLNLTQNEKEMLEHICLQIEEESGLDRASAIADMRFGFIKRVAEESVIKPHESKERIRSAKIDAFLTGKYTGIPAFIGIMALVFWLTFGLVGAFLQDLLASGIDRLTELVDSALTTANVGPGLHSLIVDGIFAGVGSVLSFIPVIIVLFFFLSLLEDSGYMARVAFIMDKLLRRLGLSGRSIVPLLIGFGCTVPAVMSSRTLSSERDRKMTILLTPFMSCSAKLPVYGFFSAAFFPNHAALVMILLYFIGIIVGIITALVMKSTAFKGEAVPFVMELPNYRLPGAKNVALLLWDKAKDFLQRAFTVIFFATIVVWFLQTYNLRFHMVEDSGDSILAMLAGLIAPLFSLHGFADWRIATALITGFVAKESVMATMEVLLGGAAITSFFSPAAGLSLLVFSLLYTPCAAAIAAVKRELGTKWAVIMVVGQCLIAWLCSLIAAFIGGLFL